MLFTSESSLCFNLTDKNLHGARRDEDDENEIWPNAIYWLSRMDQVWSRPAALVAHCWQAQMSPLFFVAVKWILSLFEIRKNKQLNFSHSSDMSEIRDFRNFLWLCCSFFGCLVWSLRAECDKFLRFRKVSSLKFQGNGFWYLHSVWAESNYYQKPLMKHVKFIFMQILLFLLKGLCVRIIS